MMQWDTHRVLKKDDKIIFDLAPCTDFLERFSQIFKNDRLDHLRVLDFDNDAIRMYGVFSDVGLTFGSPEHIKIYVNQRPVQDRVLKKAIMQAYERQLTPGLYPLAFLFVDIAGDAVDVNVHPRKQEVRFADPNAMYQCVLQTVRQTLGDQKVMQVDSTQLHNLASASFSHDNYGG
jgi:DNA mismatch repair protein MutL